MMFASLGCYCVVAEREGRIVGSNCLDERSLITGVGPISIDPDVQNMGIGRALMRAVMDRANQRGTLGPAMRWPGRSMDSVEGPIWSSPSRREPRGLFHCLCGVVEPRAILVMDGRVKRTTLFLNPRNERFVASMYGPGLEPGAAAARLTGVDAVLAHGEFAGAAEAAGREGLFVGEDFRQTDITPAS